MLFLVDVLIPRPAHTASVTSAPPPPSLTPAPPLPYARPPPPLLNSPRHISAPHLTAEANPPPEPGERLHGLTGETPWSYLAGAERDMPPVASITGHAAGGSSRERTNPDVVCYHQHRRPAIVIFLNSGGPASTFGPRRLLLMAKLYLSLVLLSFILLLL